MLPSCFSHVPGVETNTQRYGPEELDELADHLRDEAVRLATVELPGRFRVPDDEDRHLLAQIDTRVALARLLREDAEAMRRTVRRAADARPR